MEESEKEKEAGKESDRPPYVYEDNDDQIDLYELTMVLARRWKLILGIFEKVVLIMV